MSPAKPADLQTPNSTRERTDCTSSLATPAALDDPSQQSRPVSLPKLARDADNKVKKFAVLHWRIGAVLASHTDLSTTRWCGSILSIGLGSWARCAFGG